LTSAEATIRTPTAKCPWYGAAGHSRWGLNGVRSQVVNNFPQSAMRRLRRYFASVFAPPCPPALGTAVLRRPGRRDLVATLLTRPVDHRHTTLGPDELELLSHLRLGPALVARLPGLRRAVECYDPFPSIATA